MPAVIRVDKRFYTCVKRATKYMIWDMHSCQLSRRQ